MRHYHQEVTYYHTHTPPSFRPPFAVPHTHTHIGFTHNSCERLLTESLVGFILEYVYSIFPAFCPKYIDKDTRTIDV